MPKALSRFIQIRQCDIIEISRPTTWPGILRVMAENGMEEVGMKKLKPLGILEDDVLVLDFPEGEEVFAPYTP